MTVANLFTLIRLLLSPTLLWAFASSNLFLVVAIWVTAAITDLLDGWAARRFNQISIWGKILDPLADKFTVGFSLFGLMLKSDLPICLVVIYVIKEIIQVVGGSYLIYKRSEYVDAVLPSNLWGKAGTFSFFVGFFLYFWSDFEGLIFVGMGLFLSIIALYNYARLFWRVVCLGPVSKKSKHN